MLTEKHSESNKEDQVGIMVCIPTHNAESTISEVVKRCKEFAVPSATNPYYGGKSTCG